ncbi:MAG: protein kinase domain-containing protein [Chthoniobacterales bacterium]
MNQEHWRRLKEIVADALEEDSPVARTSLLQRECGEDLRLLREAESFLVAADTISATGTDRLEECALVAGTAVRRERSSLTGHRVGAYVIVKELGHGGMATVYLGARADGYFEKEVAIKILKPVDGSTAELLDRFRAEREVLASLDHPNIAALFDAGTTTEGLPYFVMEYVPGTPVTNYVNEHHLALRQRLSLFLKICAAVEVAHRRRVVHRDLKRSNILVTAEGEPKLLDFGIAKLLEENPLALTAAGQQRLTPISASPEQARGDEVTTSSDIYALGALLYEMLTGQTPHQFRTRHPSLDEVERVVCEEEPILPSVAAAPENRHTLRGDLDAIITRAMRKDPAQRYASVADLETDIRHYLAGEPVGARPNTVPYRLLRFVGRHTPSSKRVALTALLLIVALAAGFLLFRKGVTSHVTKAYRQPAATIPARSIAVLPFDDFAAPDGTSYFADGVQDDVLTDLAKAEELKVISRSGVSQYRKGVRDVREIRQNLGVAYVLEGSVRRMKDRVRVNAQLIDTESDVQVWAEQYDRKLEDLFALQSDLSQAIVAQLKGKLSAREKAAIESHPTADVQAYDLYLRARKAFVQYEYATTIDLLNQAVTRDPKFALAYCLLTNAHLYVYRFGGDMSPERLEKARVAAETALQLAPNMAESHLAKAQYYYNGLRDYEKAQAELASAPPPAPDGRARFFDLSALTERRLGHWKEALRDGEKAWELDPHDPFIATEIIQTHMSLRRYPEAEKRADEAIKNITSRSAPFWSLKAESMLAQGEPERAQSFLKGASNLSGESHFELAQAAFYERNFVEALREVEVARKSEMAPSPQVLDLMEGTIARSQGDTQKSQQAFEKARQYLEALLEKHPHEASTLIDLAWAYAGLGRGDDALRSSEEAVQLVPTWRDGAEGPAYAGMRAQILGWLGNKDAALDQLEALVKQPASPSYGDLKLNPSWDDLRGDPRFEQLLVEARKPIRLE